MRVRYYINGNNSEQALSSDSFKKYINSGPSDAFNFNNLTMAATVHIFYPDLTEEIMKRLANIPGKIKLKVLITTDTKSKKYIIEDKMKNYNYDYKIKLFKNIGRDIAPSFIGFKDEIIQSDYMLHLHSKKSLYNSDLNKWRKDIFNKLLGNKIISKNNLNFLLQPEIGMIIPSPPVFIRPHMNWGHKQDFILAKKLLRRSDIKISKLNPLYFPAGSMFMAKTKAIEPLINSITINDFQKELGQVSGTMAHAIERSFLFFCEKANLKWLVVDIDKDNQPKYLMPKYKLIKKIPITYFILNLKKRWQG